MFELIERHARKGVVVDTNVFLLLLVGSLDKTLIPNFKRTDKYRAEDYDLLIALLRRFDAIITTQSILTEVSNLAFPLNKKQPEVFEGLRNLIRSLDERSKTSTMLSESDCFPRFGLTDASIADVAADGHLVLTDDFPLYMYLSTNGRDVVNFTHIRQEYGL